MQYGQEVRKYLPPDTPANRKKPFLKNLFVEFDRVDGKPTEADLKVIVDRCKRGTSVWGFSEHACYVPKQGLLKAAHCLSNIPLQHSSHTLQNMLVTCQNSASLLKATHCLSNIPLQHSSHTHLNNCIRALHNFKASICLLHRLQLVH